MCASRLANISALAKNMVTLCPQLSALGFRTILANDGLVPIELLEDGLIVVGLFVFAVWVVLVVAGVVDVLVGVDGGVEAVAVGVVLAGCAGAGALAGEAYIATTSVVSEPSSEPFSTAKPTSL